MSATLHEQVVEQARLLVRFLSVVSGDGERPVGLVGPSAELAERLFQGLEDLHEAALQPEGAAPTRSAAPPNPEAKRQAYRGMIERIRARVTAELPPGSTVAVVSRGDGSLLQLPGLTGWHFPQNDLGVWAGFHPATGRDAVDQLESLRRSGAHYLLIPGTGFWWLEFYDELREHLESYCRLVAADEDLVLYEIGQQEGPPASSPATARYYRQAEQFTELVDALLPVGSRVSVVSRGDDALLGTHRVRALHFPSDTSATYSGSPSDSFEAIRALTVGVDAGVEYFAVPSPLRWWKDVYPEFFDHLNRAFRCIAAQAEAGVIFELIRPKAET